MAINDRACCITDLEVLEELKAREEEKAQVEEMKLAKKLEREKKAQERKEAKERRALEKQRKRNEREKTLRRKGSRSQPMGVCAEDLASDLERLTVLHDDSDGECPNCGKLFSKECLWVCCDECQQWYDIECQKLSRKNIPDEFVCNQCK